jgi:uncharacterized protein
MRDGVQLSASLYLPKEMPGRAPCVLALTPYTVQRNHLRAAYLASHGYPFLVVDVRGRGNSGGTFRPFVHDAADACDAINWLAEQDFCDGRVAMFSGSYEGYVQWAAAKLQPQPLATIVPGIAAAPGIDFPMRNNIFSSYLMQWLTFVADRTLQEQIFTDQDLWRDRFREWYESGRPFSELDVFVGNPSPIFQEWLSHPVQGAYWDALTPTAAEFARIDLPILTLTGIYDSDQPGALHYYREHLRHATPAAAAKHYLVIGPWDHGSTFAPKPEAGGVKVGPAAHVDILRLHREWYEWTLRGGQRPEFLQRRVAYYVMGAEKWRYADSLEAVTARTTQLYLQSAANPSDVFGSGLLSADAPGVGGPDHYLYDPRDVSLAKIESTVDPENRLDQRMVHVASGRQLVYHSRPFDTDFEIAGFFKLVIWLSLDQPDTDVRAAVYEVLQDGSSIQLTEDRMRARYREGLREEKLIDTTAPLRYEIERFTFMARQIKKGHRLRLVIGPVASIYSQKNYNSGGNVSRESVKDARTVTVRIFHDATHPSALHVPLGRAED